MKCWSTALSGFLCLLLSAFARCEDDVNGKANNDLIFSIEHNIGNVFYPRSQAHVSIKSDGKQSLSFPDKNGIYNESAEHFKSLLSSSSLYTISIRSSASDSTVPSVVTSIPAVRIIKIVHPLYLYMFLQCELQKSGFKEDLAIFLDEHRNIIGVSYSSPAMALQRPCDPTKVSLSVVYVFLRRPYENCCLQVKDQINLQTRLKIADSMSAQAIPLQAIGPRPGNLKEIDLGSAEDGSMKPKAPPQTFLRKYVSINSIASV